MYIINEFSKNLLMMNAVSGEFPSSLSNIG